ncbi:MAG: hypothetical protein AAFQ45_05195 [Pseudomonadota bacterium]
MFNEVLAAWRPFARLAAAIALPLLAAAPAAASETVLRMLDGYATSLDEVAASANALEDAERRRDLIGDVDQSKAFLALARKVVTRSGADPALKARFEDELRRRSALNACGKEFISFFCHVEADLARIRSDLNRKNVGVSVSLAQACRQALRLSGSGDRVRVRAPYSRARRRRRGDPVLCPKPAELIADIKSAKSPGAAAGHVLYADSCRLTYWSLNDLNAIYDLGIAIDDPAVKEARGNVGFVKGQVAQIRFDRALVYCTGVIDRTDPQLTSDRALFAMMRDGAAANRDMSRVLRRIRRAARR